jgi:SAM domain (Sterile alpha motif)
MFVPSANASGPRFRVKKTGNIAAQPATFSSGAQQPPLSELERKMQARRSGSGQVPSPFASVAAVRSKPENLQQFLASVGCSALNELFTENGFDGMSLIENLTEEDLDDLGTQLTFVCVYVCMCVTLCVCVSVCLCVCVCVCVA